MVVFLTQIFLLGIPTYLFIAFAAISAFFIYMEYRIIQIIKSQAPGKFKPLKKDVHLNLSMFSKPQKLTEEEVTVSKERKICLVCKNKVFRINYICPECYALYCIKCADVLSDLENACWVCETSFDESKPTKIERIKELESTNRKKLIKTPNKSTKIISSSRS